MSFKLVQNSPFLKGPKKKIARITQVNIKCKCIAFGKTARCFALEVKAKNVNEKNFRESWYTKSTFT